MPTLSDWPVRHLKKIEITAYLPFECLPLEAQARYIKFMLCRRASAGVSTRVKAGRDGLTEGDVNLEALNHYVLVVIGLFAAALYVGMVFAGLSELVSRLAKPKKPRKRVRAIARPRLRNAKKST